MEINALFDLWDAFNERLMAHPDHLHEPFYHFPVGTSCKEVVAWFDKQNPFFTVVDYGDKQLPKYSVIRIPASEQADEEETDNGPKPTPTPPPPRPAIA
jgi:hypothetical protein